VVGLLALRALQRRSASASLVVLVVVAHGSLAVSALGSATAMFLSPHDLRVLLAVVVVAGPAGLGVALLLGRSLVRGSDSLGAAVAGLGQRPYATPDLPLGAELTALDRRLVEADGRLRESLRRERELEAGRRELVYWISHDLRTPLAGLRAMSEALLDGVVDDPETCRRYYRGMHRETQRLTGLVEDLFEMSRIDAGDVRLTLQQVPVADLLSDAVASLAPVARSRGVRLVATPPAPALLVSASLPEIGRLLANVMSNAVRHTPAGGAVSVLAHREGDRAVIEVTDACGGIPATDLSRVFDVGFRGTAARTPGDGGSGMGLAIARGLVQAHGGDISVANDGPGCRVRVELPVAAQDLGRVLIARAGDVTADRS